MDRKQMTEASVLKTNISIISKKIFFLTSVRQWIYQTCSEYGWYQTSGSKNQPFGSSFPIDLYYRLCADIYSSTLTSRAIDANARRINQLYGALSLNITNIHSTHGQIDPWSAMGLKQKMNEEAPTTIIPCKLICNF